MKRHLGHLTGFRTVDDQEVIAAHSPVRLGPGPVDLVELQQREHLGEIQTAPFATRPVGAGHRARTEQPDRMRTCFERDLDRIHHSTAFRRLAGKCQVFLAPDDDHLRTRLTHAIEVSQVAVSLARPLGLNVELTAAMAAGHDCGHGPAGHASEEALSIFLEDGYHHAVYGADVVLTPLNLCQETLDGIRNHSWNRPSPGTPEAEVVAWADRIAYLCHDFEDAVRAEVITPEDLPKEVQSLIGSDRREQLHGFITAMHETMAQTGVVGMRRGEAEALAIFREFNYERIYLRPASMRQAAQVIDLLRALTEWYCTNPNEIPGRDPQSDPTEAAVQYVSGMTDRFALRMAVEKLGWKSESLPRIG